MKMLIALAFLPFLWASVRFSADLLAQAPWQSVPWDDLLCFGLGLSLSISLFAFGIRPNWLYVFGHESTHALAVWLHRGSVSEFKTSSKGGHIVADRDSTVISLSPYLIPFYPIALAAIWALCLWVWPSWSFWDFLFLLCWGTAWGFHLSFTISLLFTRQPDFLNHGYFYSIVLILLGNVWIFSGGVWAVFTPFGPGYGWDRIAGLTVATYGGILGWLVDVYAMLI